MTTNLLKNNFFFANIYNNNVIKQANIIVDVLIFARRSFIINFALENANKILIKQVKSLKTKVKELKTKLKELIKTLNVANKQMKILKTRLK